MPEHQTMLAAAIVVLCKIAHGRTDNGRPLAGETARQLARDMLVEHGVNWAKTKGGPDVE